MQRCNQTTCNHPTDYRFRQHVFSSKYNINMWFSVASFYFYVLPHISLGWLVGLNSYLGKSHCSSRSPADTSLSLSPGHLWPAEKSLRSSPRQFFGACSGKLNTQTLKQAKIQQKTEVNPVFAFPHDPGKPPVNHPQWKAFYLHRTQGISARYLIFKIQTCFPSTSLVLQINNLISATIMFCSMLREEYCFCPHFIFITLYV